MILLVCVVSKLTITEQQMGECLEKTISPMPSFTQLPLLYVYGWDLMGFSSSSLACPRVSYLFSSHLDGHVWG